MDGQRRRRLAALVEFNDRRIVEWQSRAPGGEFRRRAGAEWAFTAVPSPRYNNVMTAQFPSGTASPRVAQLTAELSARRKAFGWVVGPSTRPRQLGRILARAGFRHETNIQAMALGLRVADFGAAPADLRIKRVSGPREVALWAATVGRAFGDRHAEAAPIARLERALGVGPNSPRQLYIGYKGGQAVATSMLFVASRTAGLYSVGVLNRYRGRGYGAALTAAALEDGRRRGCTVGTLYASRLGVGLYRNMGFDKVGTTQIWVYERAANGAVKGS